MFDMDIFIISEKFWKWLLSEIVNPINVTNELRMHEWVELYAMNPSLVPRPPPGFPSLAVRITLTPTLSCFSVLQATESWAEAWERGYMNPTI